MEVKMPVKMSKAMTKEAPGGAPATRKSKRGFDVLEGGAAERVIPEFERLIHERIRLGIVSALAVNESSTFNELKKALNTTDGNLSVHARKLEEAEYIVCVKSFEGRMPKTEYRLTPNGRKALNKYLND